MKRRTLPVLAATCAALLLAGCASAGGSGQASDPIPAKAKVERGMPAAWESQVDFDRMGEQIIAGWIDEGRTFAVVTWGSSTCPPVADTLQVKAADKLTLVFGPSPNQICTADMAPTTHTFDLPSGLSKRPIELTVEESEFNRSQTLKLE